MVTSMESKTACWTGLRRCLTPQASQCDFIADRASNAESSSSCPVGSKSSCAQDAFKASPEISWALRLEAKKSLAKACLLELAGRHLVSLQVAKMKKRSQDAINRETPRSRANGSFDSPRPKHSKPAVERGGKDKDGGGARHAVPAMVLPRWESLEVFQMEKLDLSKLRLASDIYPNTRQRSALVCSKCAKIAGPGEAILALSCSHAFCPHCFEAFLRKRWAALAAQEVAASEKEQIPCPTCSINLQRQDVHTLTTEELERLCARIRQHRAATASPVLAPAAVLAPVSNLAPSVTAPGGADRAAGPDRQDAGLTGLMLTGGSLTLGIGGSLGSGGGLKLLGDGKFAGGISPKPLKEGVISGGSLSLGVGGQLLPRTSRTVTSVGRSSGSSVAAVGATSNPGNSGGRGSPVSATPTAPSGSTPLSVSDRRRSTAGVVRQPQPSTPPQQQQSQKRTQSQGPVQRGYQLHESSFPSSHTPPSQSNPLSSVLLASQHQTHQLEPFTKGQPPMQPKLQPQTPQQRQHSQQQQSLQTPQQLQGLLPQFPHHGQQSPDMAHRLSRVSPLMQMSRSPISVPERQHSSHFHSKLGNPAGGSVTLPMGGGLLSAMDAAAAGNGMIIASTKGPLQSPIQDPSGILGNLGSLQLPVHGGAAATPAASFRPGPGQLQQSGVVAAALQAVGLGMGRPGAGSMTLPPAGRPAGGSLALPPPSANGSNSAAAAAAVAVSAAVRQRSIAERSMNQSPVGIADPSSKPSSTKHSTTTTPHAGGLSKPSTAGSCGSGLSSTARSFTQSQGQPSVSHISGGSAQLPTAASLAALGAQQQQMNGLMATQRTLQNLQHGALPFWRGR